jgi:hypothetical protein
MNKLVYYCNLIPEWLGWCIVGALAAVAIALIAHIIITLVNEWRN